ncbi:hypothetical protein [Streptomyces atriruber]|uniref:hypothetical protein n=1 Tax=Streptomyces atriruber TaxID=545121 RepID=UPI0006E1C7CC|nr:hypothetical protein [Streptomyces atriruber]
MAEGLRPAGAAGDPAGCDSDLTRRERRGLRLWNVGLVLALVFAGALAVTVVGPVFVTGW